MFIDQRRPPIPGAADRRSARTATCRAASTTRSRLGSKRSPATGSSRSTPRMTTPRTERVPSRIKEERAELVKHHLDVLWHDYFKPEHLEKVPNLHDLFWQANKQVSKVKASTDLADAKQLLELIDEVDAAWKATGGPEKTRVAGARADPTRRRAADCATTPWALAGRRDRGVDGAGDPAG